MYLVRTFVLLALVATTSCIPGTAEVQHRKDVRSGDIGGSAKTGEQARRSFQELVTAGDKSLLESLGMEHAYACFMGSADRFHVISFTTPDSWQKETENSSFETQFGAVDFDDYEEGANALRGVGITMPFGTWTRWRDNQDWPSFSATNRKQGENEEAKGWKVSVDADEVTIQETYNNLAGGKIQYSFNLMRSTGRFAETYKITPLYGEASLESESGRCTMFHRGKVMR